MRTVALLTPTHAKDIERFDLLCESVDRHVAGYERHYVIVNDDDLPLFQKYASDRRVIAPSSAFLPSWLWAAPRFLGFNGRRVWLSLVSKPIHGWHVQQLLKISGALKAAEDRTCIVDSDNLFFRDFDVRAYAGGEKTPLYLSRKAISADAPIHAVWTRNALASATTLANEATVTPAISGAHSSATRRRNSWWSICKRSNVSLVFPNPRLHRRASGSLPEARTTHKR